MSLNEVVSVPLGARGEILYRKKRIEACTFTTINFSPVVVDNMCEVTIFADHHEDMEAAKERLQRAVDSTEAWARSGGRSVNSLFSRLAKLNFPDFRSGNIRGLRYPNLGPARTGGIYYEDLFEGPTEDIDLTNSVLPLLVPLDDLEQKLDAKRHPGPNYEAYRWRYKNYCAAALEYLTKEHETHPPPARERVLIVRKLRTTPPVSHRDVARNFQDEVVDVVFMRRGNADLTMRSSAYVVFKSKDAASQAIGRVPNCERPTDFNYYNDNVKRRLLLLQSIVEEVPLSGSGLRGSGQWGKSNLRHAIVQRNREVEGLRNGQVQAEEPQANGAAAVALEAAVNQDQETEACMPVAQEHDQPSEQPLDRDFEMLDVPVTQPDVVAHEDDYEMPAGHSQDEDEVGYMHIGRIREEENEEYPDYDDWGDSEDEAPVQPPRRVHVNTAGFAWALHNTILQRYAPHLLSQGKKARHTEREYVQITERAFWRALDILWAKESFREEMKTILQKNDKDFGRNTYKTLLSGRRPTGKFNPYECSDPHVLTVPHWYKTLKYVHDIEGLQQTMDYLATLREHEWVALDTEGGGKSNRYAPYDPCETIQFATKNESFVVDARICIDVVPAQLFHDFLSLLFSRGARFGFDFDQADREKIKATVRGDSDEARACREVITESNVYDVRLLVARAYEEKDAADEALGPNRPAPGLPDYVREKPRLAHYVHHVTKKKFNKAYTCSFWNERPYLEEQLAYAHMDTICIILMLQTCTKRAGGRQALKDWFGDEALAEVERDNVDN